MLTLSNDFDSLLNLRILVLTLGETSHAGWWKSQFLTQVGLNFLSRLYPRSEFAAAVRSAVRAARPVHDSSIGIGGAFHLFRLPQDIERRLSQRLNDNEATLRAEIAPLLAQQEQLLEVLNKAGQPPLKHVMVGPQRLGMAREVRGNAWLGPMAAAYYAAFREGMRVFPYFEGEKRR